jgi:hypothetical protein
MGCVIARVPEPGEFAVVLESPMRERVSIQDPGARRAGQPF